MISARIHGQTRIVSDIRDEDWCSLKNLHKGLKGSILMPCCSEPGLMKGGPGTHVDKHFAHWPHSNCDWEESAPHRLAKLAIIEGCREAGFEATPECSENDWRADVLAVKGDLRVAFEVQWSGQSMEETVRRQQKLAKDNVHGIWLFKNPPKSSHKNLRPVIHELKHDVNWDFFIVKDDRETPLSDFVKARLRKLEQKIAKIPIYNSGVEVKINYAPISTTSSASSFQDTLWFYLKLVLALVVVASIIYLLAKRRPTQYVRVRRM